MRQLRQRGFTAVETIIYLGVLVLFSLAVIGTLVSLASSYRQLTLARDIADSASVSFERITREIRGATGVALAGSVLDESPGRLLLNTTDDSGAAHTISFTLENGAVNVYHDGVLEGPLTLLQASTTDLTFIMYASSSSEGVITKMTIQASSTNEVRTEQFESFVELRNSD